VHITAAAGELVKHLAAEPDALTGESPLPVLARAGAQALVSRIELDGTGAEARPLLSRKCQLDDCRCQRQRGADHADDPDSSQPEESGEVSGFLATISGS
jgi:hypothetical protein